MAYRIHPSDQPTTRRDIGALVAAARQGEERAFAALHGEFDASLVRYLRARTGPDAMRLSARTWIAVCMDLARVPPSREGFRTRLVRAAREQIDQLRPSLWRQPDPAVTRLLADVELATDGPSDFSPATVTGDAAVSRLSDALSEEQLDTVLMAVVLDCTDGEIAALTGRTRAQVRGTQLDAGKTLEQAFGAVETFRLLERATQTAAVEPPPGLVAAMARASAKSPAGRWAARAASAVAVKAALAGVLVLGSATGAAAATGSLPDVAQDRIAGLASHVGLDLPDSDEAPETDGDGTEVPADAPGVLTGPVGGAPGDTHGGDVSDVAHDPALQGRDKGQQVSDTARDAGQPADPAADRQPATPPDAGGAPQPPEPPAPKAPDPPAPVQGGNADTDAAGTDDPATTPARGGAPAAPPSP